MVVWFVSHTANSASARPWSEALSSYFTYICLAQIPCHIHRQGKNIKDVMFIIDKSKVIFCKAETECVQVHFSQSSIN